ncbi:hypothetical protein MW887_006470 [Aspergillus wentii]|nr:hypothetical protein MW887_006470 [Aspergillus wentii]
MQILTLLLTLAASLPPSLAWKLPDSFPISRRETITKGSPLYNCHADCGGVIVIADTNNYCSNSTYTTELADCLDCALAYNIWQYYGDDVAAAAKACGDNATPSASSATSGAVATATGVSNSTATQVTAATSTSSGSSSPTSNAGALFTLNSGLALFVAVAGLGIVA